MQSAPIPPNEKERMEAVHRLAILDTPPEPRFDIFTREAVLKLKVAMSMVNILDTSREWSKSCVGLDAKECDRAISFCGHALLAKNIFIVSDTLLDERFADNPMVTGAPYIRFYAGVALFDHKTGQPVGVFCVKDVKPRKFTVEETAILIGIAERAERELNRE